MPLFLKSTPYKLNIKKRNKNFRFSWKVRIGNPSLNSSFENVFIANIRAAHKHPLYDGQSSYFDVGILEVEPKLNSTLQVCFKVCAILKYLAGIPKFGN